MRTRAPQRAILGLLSLSVVLMLGIASCTHVEHSLGDSLTSDAGGGGFIPNGEAGGTATPDESTFRGLCIGTTCPEGFATCANSDGPAYKCGTDLKRDLDHCGACGNKCLHYARLHMTSRCIEGGCELECWSPKAPGDEGEWRNCNQKV
ncbi:MAG: Tryptophan synthase alpha chain, partial [Labilithrix sp.]|nr:Tryptophan synthase alpha chain [Labilithrix sp.]